MYISVFGAHYVPLWGRAGKATQTEGSYAMVTYIYIFFCLYICI